jgi:tripartite-type tricarboxylate transporter receptor subunit TctC
MLFTPASMLLLTPLLQKLSFDPDEQLLPVTNQAISDLIAGQMDFYFGNASQLLPHADTERIRLLAAGDCAEYRLAKLAIVPC